MLVNGAAALRADVDLRQRAAWGRRPPDAPAMMPEPRPAPRAAAAARPAIADNPAPMNSVFVDLGLGSWKALLTALVLPPVPLLLITLWGSALLWARRSVGWGLVWLAVAGLWLSACAGAAEAVTRGLLRPPPALPAARVDALKQDAQARKATAIIVLGGGREARAPEYGDASLSAASLERLRYGLWLGRETGVPVGFSGGVGWAQDEGLAEAQIAARIAAQEFARPLRWMDPQSRDTRENAARTLAMLDKAGVQDILLVTHAWHMPRAVRAFEEAAHGKVRVTPAPIGLAPVLDGAVLRWIPSTEGMQQMRRALREALGLWMGS